MYIAVTSRNGALRRSAMCCVGLKYAPLAQALEFASRHFESTWHSSGARNCVGRRCYKHCAPQERRPLTFASRVAAIVMLFAAVQVALARSDQGGRSQ